MALASGLVFLPSSLFQRAQFMKSELRFGISPREIPITVTQGSVAVEVKLCAAHIHCMCVLCVV